MTQEELINKLGRKWRINLCTLYELVARYYKRIGNKSIQISTHSKSLHRIIGTNNAKQASKVIDMAMDIGLFKLDSDLYGFNHIDRDDNYSRTFFVDGEISSIITNSSHMGERIGDKGKREKREIKLMLEMEEIKYTNLDLPEISSKKEYDMTNRQEEEIMAALKQRYPQIGYYQDMIDAVNNCYTIDDEGRIDPHLQTFLEPRIHKYVDRNNRTMARFGIRAYNELCSLPKRNDRIFDRNDELDYYMGKDRWFEYDLNASIYRIARSIRDGNWYDNATDIYEIFNGGPFDNEEERKKFKVICNMVHFSKDMNTACSAYRRKFKDERNLKNTELKPRLEEIKQRITEFCGNFDSEIFLHESCIVTGTVKLLLDNGIKAVQLYDCIFVEKAGSTEIRNIVDMYLHSSFNHYYNNFLSPT